MKSRVFRNFAFFTASIIFCGAPSLGVAQWHSESSQNTLVCDTIGKSSRDYPQGCTDGANGAIFVWQDARSGTNQIYAQRIDMNGHLQWAQNGIKLATTSGTAYAQTNPIITTDDSGGAYVVWLDSRYSTAPIAYGTSIFAQHILANGTLAYPDTGLPVGISLNTGCANPTLCDDGFGKAFVAWEDNRTYSQSRPDIWMNRLWQNGVKYGLTTVGTKGTVTTLPLGGHPPKYSTSFHDSTANFQPYMVNLNLNIVGKGVYQITKWISDTQIDLESYPDTGTYAYSVEVLTGLAMDTVTNKQTGPCLTSDGTGGCYLAWTTGATVPNSIYGTHIDSTCTALWDPAPKPGFQLYKDPTTSNPSQNVWLNRDGNQLLLTWQVLVGGSQEVFAERMQNKTPMDTTFVWGNAANVTNQPDDHLNPRIFGDDSVDLGAKGVLVPFIDEEPGSTDGYDIGMVRVLGDGSNHLPAAGNGFWFFEQKNHMHNDFQAVKITDPTGAGNQNGVLAVWDDATDTAIDTMLYAQRIDRDGRKYFPATGTPNTLGVAVSGISPTKKWPAKHPCLVARTDGAIAAWTDLRSGTPAIYAQLILMDGSFWIPYDTTPPTLTVQSRTPSDNDSLCNSQCSTVLAVDRGSLAAGIDTVIPVTMNNMRIEISPFTKGADSATFTVCVIDSFLNGSATVNVQDTNLLAQSMSFSYCTIPDTKAPVIHVDSLPNTTNPNTVAIQISDNGPWDRGMKSITVTSASNIHFSNVGAKFTSADSLFLDTANVIQDTLAASFCIKAVDTAGNASSYCFTYTPPQSGISESAQSPISISVFPNPTSGDATLLLGGAPSAEVTILDVLGRAVDQFHLESSYEWQASSLASGIYIVRARVGDLVLYKRIVRE